MCEKGNVLENIRGHEMRGKPLRPNQDISTGKIVFGEQTDSKSGRYRC